MKKFWRFLVIALASCVMPVCAFSACGGSGDGDTQSATVPADSTPDGSTPDDSTPTDSTPADSTPDDSTPGDSTPDDPIPENKDFERISFVGNTLDYDGLEHTLAVAGAPADATVTYTNAGPYVDVGTYTIGVKVSKAGYNDYTATAQLVINPVDLTGVTFEGASFEYDGNPHKIAIAGSLPTTAAVIYTSDVVGVTNSATEIGSYNITATIQDKNHNTLVLQATLKITANDEERFMAYSADGQLYFQNAMDDNELYLYDTATGELVKVSSAQAVDIIPYEDGIAYVSKASLISSVKTATYTNGSAATQNIFTMANMRYANISGETVYYAANGLFNDKSGIYKTDLSGEEPVTTCLSVGKAHYLKLIGNELYFADGANGNKLSKINVSGVEQARTLVVDEKINNLTYADGVLYYTVNNLLGDYIEKYTISSGVRRKLTTDAGDSLTVVDNKLYYVNVDKFSTSVIGNGIYAVSTSPLVDNNLPGERVIEGSEMGVCSLAYDGSNLYYYDVDGYKLMKYNLSNQNAVNLLDGFTRPEPGTPISTGSKMQTYGGNIYYLDIWDGKTLHCYNPATKLNYAVTTDKVVDFNIVGDVLFVNMVTTLVNNDVYSVNLKTGGNLVKISTYSAFEFCVDGEYMYYIEENAAGAKTAIHQCRLDGTEDVIVYDKGVTNLRVVDGKLYFVDGNNIHCYDMQTQTDTTVKVDGKEIHTTAFDTDGTYLYYRDMYGLVWANKQLSRCKLDGTEKIVMVEDVDPVSIQYKDGYVYYYSDTTKTAKNGLFKVSAIVTTATAGTALLAESSGYYAMEFVIVEDKLYFVDYKSQLAGDAHLYVVPVGGGEVQRLDG